MEVVIKGGRALIFLLPNINDFILGMYIIFNIYLITQQIATGQMDETVFFDNFGTLSTLATAGTTQNPDNWYANLKLNEDQK